MFLLERRAHLVAAVAVNHVHRRWFQTASAANNVPQQWHAGERLQNLGEIGLHSLALAGSEDNDSEFHEAASLAASKRIDTQSTRISGGIVCRWRYRDRSRPRPERQDCSCPAACP